MDEILILHDLIPCNWPVRLYLYLLPLQTCVSRIGWNDSSLAIWTTLSISCLFQSLKHINLLSVCPSTDWISPERSTSFWLFQLFRWLPVCIHCRRINLLEKMIDGVVHKRMGKPQCLLRDEFSKLQTLYNNQPMLEYNYELRRASFMPHYSQRTFDVSDF